MRYKNMLVIVATLLVFFANLYPQSPPNDEGLTNSLKKLRTILQKLGNDRIRYTAGDSKYDRENYHKFKATDFTGCKISYSTINILTVFEVRITATTVFVPDAKEDSSRKVVKDQKTEVKTDLVGIDKTIKQTSVLDLSLLDPEKIEIEYELKNRATLRFNSLPGKYAMDRLVIENPKSDIPKSGTVPSDRFWVKDVKLLNQLKTQLVETIKLCQQ